jgi:mono/diheme cytochrome c family protein
MKSIPKTLILLVVLIFGFISIDHAYAEQASPKNPAKSFDMKQVDHGRYLSIIAGCNDCHTPGYLLSEGKVPEKLWLTGDRFGWRGPWGTTYAVNLRTFINAMTEDQWVKTARTLKARPPMPWYALNIMKKEDLKAIYQFIRSMGASGEPAPAYLPPDQEPTTPYALFPSPPKQDRQ